MALDRLTLKGKSHTSIISVRTMPAMTLYLEFHPIEQYWPFYLYFFNIMLQCISPFVCEASNVRSITFRPGVSPVPVSMLPVFS